ncbi:MAG: hypothetical protein ACK5NT_13935 [Pyrinomonadaceae bacterium]
MCGFYVEGVQDGEADARANRDNDYKRYKSKFDSQYEVYYRDGYDRGFSSVTPYARWDSSQKDAYDRGYKFGEQDNSRNISRLPARYDGQYNKTYEPYYTKGYSDGFDRRPREYDVPVYGSNNGSSYGERRRTNSGRYGAQSGTVRWDGRVDGRVNLIVQGRTIRTQNISGRSSNIGDISLPSALPRRESTITATKLDGRGNVTVIQQPSRVNNFTGIVQVDDPKGGYDNYSVEISWQSQSISDVYSSGKLRWKGRIDDRVNITISGDDVETNALSGRSVTNETVDLNGYLARRSGNVTVRKLEGRGDVMVLEQPSALNQYTAVIQVYDSGSGEGYYDLEVSW